MARNALQYGGSDSDNPLAAAPWTIPDPSDQTVPMSQGAAVTRTASAVDQWMEAQRQKSAQMGLWNDQTGLPTMAGVNAAVSDYGNALLMGTTAPGGKMKSGPMDITHPMREETVTAFVNPSKGDLARMMQSSSVPHLRVLQEGPNVAVWPALDATHAQMREPLGFSKDAKSQDYRFRVGDPDADYPHQVGRFSFWAAEH